MFPQSCSHVPSQCSESIGSSPPWVPAIVHDLGLWTAHCSSGMISEFIFLPQLRGSQEEILVVVVAKGHFLDSWGLLPREIQVSNHSAKSAQNGSLFCGPKPGVSWLVMSFGECVGPVGDGLASSPWFNCSLLEVWIRHLRSLLLH